MEFNCDLEAQARKRTRPLGSRHTPGVADGGLHVSLLVASPYPAEVSLEEEVALQAQELPREVAFSPDDLSDGDGAVVVVLCPGALCGQ
jgi:hypothetical protein